MADLNSIGGIHYEMMRRCYNKKCIAYKDYGAKGIAVCKEWHDRDIFKTWAIKNGYVKGMRLERINTKGIYEPSNCRFGEKYKDKGHNKETRKKREYRKVKYEKYKVGKNIYSEPLYSTYYGMKTRCYNENHESYKHYGGRGISVCDEWLGKNGFLEFNKWAIENGWNEGLTIDRIDNDKGYSPSNCRWVKHAEQVKNRRNMKLYDYYGKTLCLKEICERENVSYAKLYYRVKVHNMNILDAIEEINFQGV